MVIDTRISLRKIHHNNVRKAVFAALTDIDASHLLNREGMKILLKPNILSGKPPERAVTTHPEVIRAVIQWLQQFHPSQIIVTDSSGGRNPGTTKLAMERSGIAKVCMEENVDCFPLESSPRQIYHVENPLVIDHFASSSLLHEVDLIINLPKIKTHELCTLTCCIKNMFGTILLGNKAQFHTQFPGLDQFSSALVDIYSVSLPQLTIIDGFYAMEGNGPAAGTVVKYDLILAGYDGIALDHTVCDLIGINSNSIVYLQKEKEKKLGISDRSKITYFGDPLDQCKRKFKTPMKLPLGVLNFVPSFLRRYLTSHIFKAKIKIDPKKCRLCATCWKNCPVEALSPPEKRTLGQSIPCWDSKKCITCYCCTELCPYEAINFQVSIWKNVLFSWLGISALFIIGLVSTLIIVL